MMFATKKLIDFPSAREIAVPEFCACMGVWNFMHARNSPDLKNYGFLYYKKLNCFHAMITIRSIKKIFDVIFLKPENRGVCR